MHRLTTLRCAVAAVRWAPGEAVGIRSLSFYSVSADGHICQWSLGQSSLVRQARPPSSG